MVNKDLRAVKKAIPICIRVAGIRVVEELLNVGEAIGIHITHSVRGIQRV